MAHLCHNHVAIEFISHRSDGPRGQGRSRFCIRTRISTPEMQNGGGLDGRRDHIHKEMRLVEYASCSRVHRRLSIRRLSGLLRPFPRAGSAQSILVELDYRPCGFWFGSHRNQAWNFGSHRSALSHRHRCSPSAAAFRERTWSSCLRLPCKFSASLTSICHNMFGRPPEGPHEAPANFDVTLVTATRFDA